MTPRNDKYKAGETGSLDSLDKSMNGIKEYLAGVKATPLKGSKLAGMGDNGMPPLDNEAKAAQRRINAIKDWDRLTKTTGTILGSDFASQLASGIVDKSQNKVDNTQQAVQNAVTTGLSMINPAVGTAVKLFTAAENALAPEYKTVSKGVAGTNALDSAMSAAAGIPGVKTAASLFNTKLDDLYVTREAQMMRGGFGDVLSSADSLDDYSGSHVLGPARKKLNKAIGTTQNQLDDVMGLYDINTLRKANSAADAIARNNNRLAGLSAADRVYAKNGVKLPSLEEVHKILELKKLQKEQIESFQNGGVIGTDTNILPEGALHKELNNLDDINPEVGEEVTRKGIPVIVTDENGEVDQRAEIEREEMVFRMELTKKLDELREDGSEESMIKAGKLLAEEIITNTQDNTGQLSDEVVE